MLEYLNFKGVIVPDNTSKIPKIYVSYDKGIFGISPYFGHTTLAGM